MSNLVQIEFFHLGRNQDPELYELFDAAKERFEEIFSYIETGVEPSSRMKTVLRLYDTDNILTSFAIDARKNEIRHAALLNTFMEAGWLGRKLLNRESKRVARRALELKRKCLHGAVSELSKSIQTKRPIAVEKPDNTFRLARKDELGEILSAAKGSYAVWLFVFEPNDLFSQTNKAVAHAM